MMFRPFAIVVGSLQNFILAQKFKLRISDFCPEWMIPLRKAAGMHGNFSP